MKTTPKKLTWLAAAIVLLSAGMAYNLWSDRLISKTDSQRGHPIGVVLLVSDTLFWAST